MKTRLIVAPLLAAVLALSACAVTVATDVTPSASVLPTGSSTGATTAAGTGASSSGASSTGASSTGTTAVRSSQPSAPPPWTGERTTAADTVEPVPGSRLLGIEGVTGGVQGWRGPIRIADDATLDAYLESIANRDGTAHPLAGQVGTVPDGQVLIAGVVSIGCDIPAGAALVAQDGRFILAPTGMPLPPLPECFAAVTTIAIVAAPAATVPPGSVGIGRTVVFMRQDGPARRQAAVELESDTQGVGTFDNSVMPPLPAPIPGDRRFAFLLNGCQNTAAILVVDDDTITARLDPPERPVDCAQAVSYLAVLSAPADQIPETARLTL